MKKSILTSAFLLASMPLLYAQMSQDTIGLKEVVISNTKFPMQREQSGKIIEKITSEQLQQRAGQSVAQVLNTVVGLEINCSQSSTGKNLSYYLRGGRNRQVLILIDGIPVTDASGITHEFDLRLLPVEQIEAIEVMKGAASTLYGSGAATGVINILTKKAGKENSGLAYFRLGTQNNQEQFRAKAYEVEQGASVRFSKEKLGVQIQLNHQEVSGISQANVANAEADRHSRINASTQLTYQWNAKWQLQSWIGYDRLKNQYDAAFDNTNSHDVAENVGTIENWRFQLHPTYRHRRGILKLQAGFNQVQRDFSEFSSFANAMQNYSYASRNLSLDIFHKYELNQKWFVVTGVQSQFHDMQSTTPFDEILQSNAKFNNIDPYASVVYQSDTWGLNTGVRSHMHSIYDAQWVVHVNPSYQFATLPLKLMSSYSTAYVVPSLYQLYSPFGNTNLTPEKNKTAEFGIETQWLQKSLKWQINGFFREEDNSIQFFFNPDTFVSQYINVAGKNQVRGIETSLEWRKNHWNYQANYAFTQVPEALNRLIPKHKINQQLGYQFAKSYVGLEHQWVSNRQDAFFDGTTFAVQHIGLDAYHLLHINFQHRWNDRIQFTGRIHNVLNEKFVENIGFTTLGTNVKLGMQLMF